MDNKETWKTRETKEVWKTTYISPNYKISSFGRLINTKTKNILKPQIKPNKAKGTISQVYDLYDKNSFMNKRHRKTMPVAKLVYNSFVNSDNHMPVQHKDHNNLNNKLNNLTLIQYQPGEATPNGICMAKPLEEIRTDQFIYKIKLSPLIKSYIETNNVDIDKPHVMVPVKLFKVGVLNNHKINLYLGKDGLIKSSLPNYLNNRRIKSIKYNQFLEKEQIFIRGNGIIFNSNQRIMIYHNKCHHSFNSWLNGIIYGGCGCPFCSKSHGEKVIENWLMSNNIKFKPQLRIDDCKYKNTLPFDFAIYYRESLIGLIEFQGEQHYKITFSWDKPRDLSLRKLRDNIKFNYCLNKHIPLLRIPFNHKQSINKILTDFYHKILKLYQFRGSSIK